MFLYYNKFWLYEMIAGMLLQNFTNIAAIQNVFVLQQILTLRNDCGYVTDGSKYHNAGIYWAWIEIYHVVWSKIYNNFDKVL